MSQYHETVMGWEVGDILTRGGERGGWFLDATLGGGGHSEGLLLKRTDIHVIGVDQDPDALDEARKRLAPYEGRMEWVHANFEKLSEATRGRLLDGVVMDLGVSLHQLETAERGFSFMRDGPLDMRMNPQNSLTAEEIVNCWTEDELVRILREYGEEFRTDRIVRKILEERRHRTIRGTRELADLVASALGRGGKIHPSTRVFQALRIAVNDEMGVLDAGLEQAWSVLKPGGRLAVISFHSLEDRMVKQRFRKWEIEGGLLISRKVQVPGDEEIRRNPRSRSAKLRAVEKN